MKRIILGVLAVVLIISLTGCTASNLSAPCPNYGAFCKKMPVEDR